MEKEQRMTYSYVTLLKSALHFIRPYRRKFIFGSLLRLSCDALYLYATYLLSNLIAALGYYTMGQTTRTIWFSFFGWSLAYVYVTSVRQVAKYFCYRVAETVKLDSQLYALQHLHALDISWHEKENTGNKLKRIQNGGEGLERLLRIWVDNIIEITVNFIGMIVVIAFIDAAVALIMIVFLVTYLAVSFPLARRASVAAREVNQHEEDFTGFSFEVINNIRTVKVMAMFESLFTRLQVMADRLYVSVLRRIWRFRSQSFIQSVWAHVFRVFTMVIIVYGILHGQYELSLLVLFNFYFTELRSSAEELSNVAQDITIARYRVGRLQELLDEKIQIDDDRGKVDFPKLWKKISLREVSFSYEKNSVLRNVSFDIMRGEKIGVVGLSGVGKSTLFKLLFKEYENFSGDITFDALSIRKIKKSAYFKSVAVVLQDTEVFNLSLRDNVLIVRSKQNEKEFRQALEIAHVSDFMPKLPYGVDTLIGEKGVKLSGGEKQRLGIARAIYKQPDILFLDEATSHLDLESEEKIQDSLQRFFKNVTAVVIAHRLTTIQAMDRILLFEKGTLLESGSFKELHRKRGRFFELWEKQRL